tara:strand:- start:414 stop:1109 length:696 start_codon:yes stop_codon:yes gene_type:complete
MKAHTKNRKTNNKANDTTDNNINMAPIDEARTNLGNAWSGEASAAINIASALKGYAASLDDNGLGLVAIVNADRKVPYATFKGKFGDDIFNEDDWKAARKELATLKKLWLQYYSNGAQTFEAWLQNFRRNMMLFMSVKQPSKEAAKRRSAKRKQYNAVKKKYEAGKSKPTVQTATVKISKKAKSIGVRLNQVVDLLDGIKGLENAVGKKKVDTILASIKTLRTKVEAMESK